MKETSSANKAACYYASKETGLTLIEVMITITISISMLAILLDIYFSCISQLKVESALSEIQFAAHSAANILTQEIQQAGHIGCARLTADFPIISLPSQVFNVNNQISANNQNELTVRYAEPNSAYLLEDNKHTNRIYISNNIKFDKKDILIISDCKQAEMISPQAIHQFSDRQEITLSQPLRYAYNKYAEISRFVVHKFYIAKSNRQYENGDTVHGLYMEDQWRHKYELISGITAMSIHFNIDDKQQITNAHNITAIELSLKIHSPPLTKPWFVFIKKE